MRLLRICARHLRSLFRRARVERELAAELEFHIEQQIDEHLRRGMGPAQARAAAHRAFGSVACTKDECRDSLGVRLIDRARQNVRFVVRTLSKHWTFAGISILTLALGIGASVAMFSIVNSVLLEPLHYRDPARLYSVVNVPPPPSRRAGTGTSTPATSIAGGRNAARVRTLQSRKESASRSPVPENRSGCPVCGCRTTSFERSASPRLSAANSGSRKNFPANPAN
jgi:hypothetical protein